MANNRSYFFEPELKVWVTPSHADIAYSDGAAVESRLLGGLRQCLDVGSASAEVRTCITDWPSEYHLSPLRHNLLRPFRFRPTDRILELGCGCGAITRYLGESGATVVAVEGSRRRATIAAERCRDLPNVAVYCDNLAEFETSEQFDVVTLIGVLEYSPVFITGENPVQACIEKACSFLAEGGTLIVAIENQLGLKYFAGCGEDHIGQPMFGVQGLYGPGTPVTFGRRALEKKLSAAGLEAQEFYYPFPDYKLPSIILSEAATKHPDLQVADLLARTAGGERSGQYRTFHENLAAHPIAENGLVADLANSFLVFARRTQAVGENPDWLAVSYSTGRRNRYWTQTAIIEDSGKLKVRKQPLPDRFQTQPTDTAPQRFQHQPVDSRYIQGRLWVTGLWRILANDAMKDGIAGWLRPWLDFLRAHALHGIDDAPGLDFALPGEYIDCTPFNLISTEHGALVYIDAEWRSADPIPASWVVVRGLLYTLCGCPVPAALENLAAAGLISEMLSGCGISLTESDWRKVCQLENAFQAVVNERPDPFYFETLLYRPLGKLGPLLATPQAHATLAAQKTAVEKDLVAAHADAASHRERVAFRLIAAVAKLTRPARRSAQRACRMAIAICKGLRALARRKNRLRAVLAAVNIARTQGWSALDKAFVQYINMDVMNVSYDKWIIQHDALTDEDRQYINAHISILPSRFLISILMPTYNTPERWLRQAIESVRAQLYPEWELCIADDASAAPHVRAVLEEYARIDRRFRVVYREKNGHISAASNSALALARGEFIALLDHDDELSPHALYMVAAAVNEKPCLDLIYSDEDKVDENGRRFGHYFKPDWNPDLLTSQNMVNHLGVYRTALVCALGGFREGYEGSQDWDLVLRVSERIPASHIHHIPHVLYHWRALAGSTAIGHAEKSYAADAAAAALQAHLDRTGRAGTVMPAAGGYFRICHPVPSPAPKVSIIIPTRNGVHLLRRCIDSIRQKTQYPNYEILVVDNQSDDPETLQYLQALESEGLARILEYDRPFNYSAINNFAADAAEGSFLCLMNNDIEVISENWLDEMTGQAARTEIGVVGAMLYYPDNTIQHAGVILGMGGVAGHLYGGHPRGTPGYLSRLRLVQNLSAVTAACIVVRASIYRQVGGLDAENLPVAFNDVDFCLRVEEQGYRNLWTPFAELYHHESATRGYEDTEQKRQRFTREAAYMRSRWPHRLHNDPAHNPNLSLDHAFPYLASVPRVSKPWRR